VDNFSLSVAPLELFGRKNEEWIQCGVGTGFFYKGDEALNLITNWHVVTGVDPLTMRSVDQDPVPEAVRIYCKRRLENPPRLQPSPHEVHLYNRGTAVWNEHSTRQNVDVVSLKLDAQALGTDFANVPINTVEQEHHLRLYPGMDCFVLGYPLGMNGPGQSPIWKRASIATEPLYNFRNTPGFLIDTATREGMSGSPVVARHSGIFRRDEGQGPPPADTIIGTMNKFIGIYSGRLGNDPLEVQLGMVWQSNVLEDVTSGRTQGFNPFK
jgi:Trypsin-like peptidase domain